MVEATKSHKGLDHIKKAQYALKTGVFKWSKDYDEAAM
jgi:hypothetical protein